MQVPYILTLPRLHEIAAPLYIAFLLTEFFLVRNGALRGHFRREDTHTSLIMGIGSVVSGIVIGGLGIGVVLWAYENRLTTIGFAWWAFVTCFVLDDLRFYWGHRIQHRSRWFWAAHVVHHSSEYYNFSTALRQPWTGQITGLVLLAVPLAYLGFHPALIAFCASLNLFYQFFLHTESVGRLPAWIEAMFNTPSHHRVHHARNPRYLDANYAGTLIIWDKLFGTFVPELDRDKPEFGLVKNVNTYNPFAVALGEYWGIATDVVHPSVPVLDRVRYLFAPPGFSHDGSRKDSHMIKQDYLRDHPQEAGTEGLKT
ncbi:MAG: sterol desaturase family protein [Alphaproteobacteria bacterium]|nr:sterol desaturase family protein [Alphaproteobacteria bacterium]